MNPPPTKEELRELAYALECAADVLRTEANELAALMDAKAFDQMNYRVKIAVRSEIERLRSVAETLRCEYQSRMDAFLLKGPERT